MIRSMVDLLIIAQSSASWIEVVAVKQLRIVTKIGLVHNGSVDYLPTCQPC